MKQLTCEMCGGTDLLKQEGVFVCQTCGCKYSVEEAKKMMVEGTVEVQGTVKIDKSENYDNLLKLAREAFIDHRFDSADNYCKEALMIFPHEPELIAMQGLAVLGKEPVVIDVPTSSKNAMERMLKLMVDYQAAFSVRHKILTNTLDYLRIAAIAKMEELNIENAEIGAQKIGASSAGWADFNLGMQSLFGDRLSQMEAKRDLEKARQEQRHDAALDAKIRKNLEKAKKVRDFVSHYETVIINMVHDEYWQEHHDEKVKLDKTREDLSKQVTVLMSAIENDPDFKNRNEMEAEIKKLEKWKDELYGFSIDKKRKKYEEQIAELQSKLTSLDGRLFSKVNPLQAQIDEIDKMLNTLPFQKEADIEG